MLQLQDAALAAAAALRDEILYTGLTERTNTPQIPDRPRHTRQGIFLFGVPACFAAQKAVNWVQKMPEKELH